MRAIDMLLLGLFLLLFSEHIAWALVAVWKRLNRRSIETVNRWLGGSQ